MRNIVLTGSLGYDHIMDFHGHIRDRIMPDKIHTISLSLLVDSLTKQFGGITGNIAYTLKLLGMDPMIYSYAGTDFDAYRKHLEKHGIQTGCIPVSNDSPSSTYFVITDADDNQIGGYYRGALLQNTTLSLARIKEKIDFVVISANEPAAMIKFVKECKRLKLPYMYDPAFQIGDFSKGELLDGISHASVLIGNDYEIALIEKRMRLSHTALISLVPICITTLGSKGSRIESNGKTYTILPVRSKKVSDPTGAGDAYRAGFLAGFLRTFDLQTCGQMGSLTAVYTVEKYGTQTHAFAQKDFCKRYTKTYKQSLML